MGAHRRHHACCCQAPPPPARAAAASWPLPPHRRPCSLAQVLFCGYDMHWGFVFTKEALEGEEGVEVRRCLWPAAVLSCRASAAAALTGSTGAAAASACWAQLYLLRCHLAALVAAALCSQVEQCDRSELPLLLRSADVAVPLMSALDSQVRPARLPPASLTPCACWGNVLLRGQIGAP